MENFRQLNDHLSGKELFIRLSASDFRELLSVYVFIYFPFGFEGRIWDLIVSVPDHSLSFYLEEHSPKYRKSIADSESGYLTGLQHVTNNKA